MRFAEANRTRGQSVPGSAATDSNYSLDGSLNLQQEDLLELDTTDSIGTVPLVYLSAFKVFTGVRDYAPGFPLCMEYVCIVWVVADIILWTRAYY